MERNHINVVIATIHVLRLVILKSTCEHIVVINLTNVTSVTMPALPPVILGDTKQLTNIAKGTTDPGVDYFNQVLWFGLVGLV